MDDRALQLWRSRKRPRGQRSTSAGTGGDYDVFLNHRGPDVKAGFVAHLDEALRAAGLNPFLDKATLRKGHPAFASIEGALEVAKIHVAVVSKGYAESKYCLNELVAMIRSGKPVVPVFYDVEPAQVRWVESGPFAAAFEKHKSKRTMEQVQEWRDALGKLADVTGFCFRLSDYKGDETELKWEVVDTIMNLMPTMEVLQVDCQLVGMGEHLNMCIKTLELMSASATCLLGIVGMGGVGKTLLAKELYNYFVGRKSFQAVSYVEVDGHLPLSIEARWGLMSKLQEQLLWDLLHVCDNNPRRYKYWFQKLSRQGPILVVLDDVHKKSQFDELILDPRLLAQGSCIIVTSRDQHLLKVIAQKLEFYLHEVRPLGKDDSQKLFNLHAFGDEVAPEKLKALAYDVSKGCGGLPLALKVVGSSLFDKRCDEDLECIWPEAIDALKEDSTVISALQWSYDCLSEREKLMFVDIACVFHGRMKKEALEIWKSCKECSSCCGFGAPHTSLRELIDKSLVVLKDYDGLSMHGLLQDLGQSIGICNGSHLSKGNGSKALENKSQGLSKVRALNLSNSGSDRFESESFARLTNLHFLILDGCKVDGDFGSISKELGWLQWRYMPLTYLPPMASFSKLTSLDFSESTKLANLWVESNSAFEGCPNLLELDMRGCTSITTLPDSIDRLSELQVLKLGWCMNLQKLPSSIGQLTALEVLHLNDCRSLQALPDSITALSKLHWLHLWDCLSISKLPISFGHLIGLTCLSIDLVTEWQAVAIGQLSALEIPLLSKCSNEAITALDSSDALISLHHLYNFGVMWSPSMTKLPKTIGLLTNLHQLKLHQCWKLRKLPNCIGHLKLLEALFVSECLSLETLPSSLGALACLQELWIIKCISFKRLPTSIGLLSSLHVLTIDGCNVLQSFLESVKHLHVLRMLTIMDCGSLEGLGVVRALQGLRIWGRSTSIMSELPGSCLMVVDSNFFDPAWYENDFNLFINNLYQSNLKEVQVVEADACGYLRLVQESETMRLMWQRVYTFQF